MLSLREIRNKQVPHIAFGYNNNNNHEQSEKHAGNNIAAAK